MKQIHDIIHSKKILIGVIIASLLIGGTALAATQIWSATTSITIEAPDNGDEPDPEPALIITGVDVSAGVLEDGVWTVSLTRPEIDEQPPYESLDVCIENPRTTYSGSYAAAIPLVGGEEISIKFIAPGVWVSSLVKSIPPGETIHLIFQVHVGADAELGTLPDIVLGIRERE